MSTKYKATTTEDAYFITIMGWADIFTRLNQKQIIIQALHYCQDQKGLRNLWILYYAQSYSSALQSNKRFYTIRFDA